VGKFSERGHWDALVAQVPFDISILRLYSNDDIFDVVAAARQAAGDQAPNLLRWFRMPFPEGADAESVAALLRGLPVIAQAFVETYPVPAATSTEPLRVQQTWQDASPTGIGVDAARNEMGAGVNYVDVEYG
jgi:hypothetical protein